jgi:hypothetical protein
LLPAGIFAFVVLAIIVTELCGREDVQPLAQTPSGPTATVGPTFTPGPSPTTGPEQETATAEIAFGGENRDRTRETDLAAVAQVLETYREENGEYPTTNNNIQTLCVFEENDSGCALKEVLDPLPLDPLGSPADNGYFYQSDGERFVLYAIRESEVVPECDDHPQHLAGFDSIMCVRGPSEGTPEP